MGTVFQLNDAYRRFVIDWPNDALIASDWVARYLGIADQVETGIVVFFPGVCIPIERQTKLKLQQQRLEKEQRARLVEMNRAARRTTKAFETRR